MVRQITWYNQVMIFVLSLALIARLILLNQSLWLDESIQALALMGKMGPLLQYALADFQPPLYHFVGYLFTHVFGYSEIALRLPSLFAGLGTVYFIAKITEFLSTRKIGLLAGILAATNPLFIYYSQEGRTYALTTFLVTASFYYFLRLLKGKSTKDSVAYMIFTTLFLWTSYLSWFALLAQGLYALFKKRSDLFALQALSALTLLPWLPSFLTSLGIGRSTISLSPSWGQVVGGLTWKSLPLTWVKFALGRISFDNKWLYGGIVAAIAILHVYVLSRIKRGKYPLLLVWLLLPISLSLLISAWIPVYAYFRVLFVLPVYLILLALGSLQLKNKFPYYLLCAIQLCAIGYFWVTPRYHREDWRALVSGFDSSAVLAMPSRAQDAPLIYYGWKGKIIEPSHEPIVGSPIYYIRYAEDLFDASRLGQANLLSSGYTITSQKVYPGIQLDIYEKK